jgi:hypothetical protein
VIEEYLDIVAVLAMAVVALAAFFGLVVRLVAGGV